MDGRSVVTDASGAPASVRELGGIRIDLMRQEVHVDGRPVHLTRSELKLLALLSEEPGRVYTRAEIMRRVWNSDYGEAGHACEVHISNLRRKLEREPPRPERLITVRGVGYRLEAV